MSDAATRGYLFVMMVMANEQGFDAYIDDTLNHVVLGGNMTASSWDEFEHFGGKRPQLIAA